MLKSDFYYDLPQELIAQTPLEPRDSSRLMKIDRKSGEITHDRFYNICDYLEKGDLLVLNDSKVFPARLYGVKQETIAICSSLISGIIIGTSSVKRLAELLDITGHSCFA